MRRELLLLEEMIDAAEQAHLLALDQTPELLAQMANIATPCCGTSRSSARPPRSFPDEVKANHPEIPWQQPSRLRNRIVHDYWSIDLDILTTTTARAIARHGLTSCATAHEALEARRRSCPTAWSRTQRTDAVISMSSGAKHQVDQQLRTRPALRPQPQPIRLSVASAQAL